MSNIDKMGGHHGHFGFENFEAILANVCVIFIRLENADCSLFIRQDFVAGQESKWKVDIVGLEEDKEDSIIWR